MSKQLRVAVIGLGIGRVNGRAIAANPRGHIVALCDLIEPKMDDFEKELGHPVKKFTDYRKMLGEKDIDAVFVGTPNQLHIEMALAVIKAGKHVMVTKPLGHAVAPALKLVAAAEKSGMVNMMSLSTRFGPECQHTANLARDGYFGRIYYAKARSIRRSGIPNWNLGFIEAGGGAFRDMGVHCLDAAWWLLGMPRPISVMGVAGAEFGPRGLGYWDFHHPAKSFYQRYASDDYAGGFVRFEGNIGMQVESFWAAHSPEEFQVELLGTAAGARVFPTPTFYRTAHGAPHDTTVKIPKALSEPWTAIAGHFIDCCLDGVACRAPLRHGLVVQQMMESLLRSAKTGREERL